MKLHNLVGQRFGELLVLEKTNLRKNKHVIWRCSCSCGNNDYLVITDHLVRKSYPVRSCGCLSRIKREKIIISETLTLQGQSGSNNSHWMGYKGFPLSLFNNIKKRAITNSRRVVTFELTIEYLWDLFEIQNRKCALSGVALCMLPRSAANVSLDRIDSRLGYIEGNVQWVHKHVNIMKNSFPELYFVQFANLIARLHPSDISSFDCDKENIRWGSNLL